MQVEVKHLYRSPGHNYYGRYGKGSLDHPILEEEELHLVAGSGIEGDRFFDYKEDYKGQITFFDEAVYQKVCSEVAGAEVEPWAFRRNVIVAGVDLNSLIGNRFRLGDLEFTGSGECSPCFWMDEACAEGTHAFLKDRGGLRARITCGGTLKRGPYSLVVTGEEVPDA